MTQKYLDAVKQRKRLEQKYTSIACNSNIELPYLRDTFESVSPTAWVYRSGRYGKSEDKEMFHYCTHVIHDEGPRAEIERELIKMGIRKLIIEALYSGVPYYEAQDHVLYLSECEIKAFFKLKNIFVDNAHKLRGKINENKLNKMLKLCQKWTQIAKEEHYQVDGALRRIQKRIHKKNKKK